MHLHRRIQGVRFNNRTGIALTAALICLAPLVSGSYQLSVLTAMMIYSIFAMSLNLLVGYAGIASLGHAAFFGVGGYTVALLSSAGVGGFLGPLVLAIAASLLAGAIFGVLTLRASGAYQFMITLSLAQVLWGVVYGWRSLTGGDDGIPGIASPVSFHEFARPTINYWIVSLFFAGVLFASSLFARSPFGRSLVGIRENAQRMRVLGYDVWIVRFIAFLLAAGVAGLAGALFAWHNGFVAPSYLSVTSSALVLIMVIAGGAGTILGPVVGAFLIVGCQSVAGNLTERWVLILGLIYIATSLFAPNGVIGLFGRKAGHGG